MIKYLIKYPPKIMNRILLIIGIIIFTPVYCYNYYLISKIMNLDTLNKLLTSFNSSVFKDIILRISEQGDLETLFYIYLLNIISTVGFMLFSFSITLIVARTIKQSSRFYKISFIFPILVLIVALLDFIASILFLMISSTPNIISDFTTNTIDLCYVIRIIILYIVILWLLFIGIYLLISKIRKQR